MLQISRSRVRIKVGDVDVGNLLGINRLGPEATSFVTAR